MDYVPLNVKGNSRKSMKEEITHLFLGENSVESGVVLCMKWPTWKQENCVKK